MKHLVYFSYGLGSHALEVRFSILSARRFLSNQARACRIVLFTDCPSLFPDRGIQVERVTGSQLEHWASPHGYIHRRKICLVQYALENLRTPIAFIDTDTYFTKSPLLLFDRISPGRTVLHMREGHLSRWNGARLADSIAQRVPLLALNGAEWRITPNTHMWNSGVIGMHPDQLPLIPEILNLNDELYPPALFRTTEQFAVGVVLANRTNLSEARDVVHHYWFVPRRTKFDAALRQVMEVEDDDDLRWRKLQRSLPRQSVKGRALFRLLRALEHFGLAGPGYANVS